MFNRPINGVFVALLSALFCACGTGDISSRGHLRHDAMRFYVVIPENPIKDDCVYVVMGRTLVGRDLITDKKVLENGIIKSDKICGKLEQEGVFTLPWIRFQRLLMEPLTQHPGVYEMSVFGSNADFLDFIVRANGAGKRCVWADGGLLLIVE